MLTKETFVQAIQAIQEQEKLTDQMNEIYRRMTEGLGSLVLDGMVQNVLVKTLSEAMEDPFDYVSWCLYDAPKEKKTVSWEEDGKTITVDLADANDLYDYLVQCAVERKENMK